MCIRDRVSEAFRGELEYKKISLVYSLDSSVGDVPFDAAKCEIILSNLIMNALKFSDESTTVTISSCLEQGYARVLVSDEGIGLANVEAVYKRQHQCRYAVHAEAAVFDFGRAEAYSASGQFGFFASSVFQGEDERVQVRMFGTPGFYTGDCRFFEYNPAVFSSRDFSFLFQDGFAVGIFQLVSDAAVRIGRTGNLNVQVEDSVFVSILVESGYHLVVGNILPGRAVEVDAPFDTCLLYTSGPRREMKKSVSWDEELVFVRSRIQ